MSKVAVCIDWIEFERGWGTRPDGVTLHKDLDTAKAFVKAYWDRMPEDTPAEYSYPNDPRAVEVSDEHWARLQLDGSFWVSLRAHVSDAELR